MGATHEVGWLDVAVDEPYLMHGTQIVQHVQYEVRGDRAGDEVVQTVAPHPVPADRHIISSQQLHH